MVRDTEIIGYMDFGSIDISLIDVNDNGPVFYTVSLHLYHCDHHHHHHYH